MKNIFKLLTLLILVSCSKSEEVNYFTGTYTLSDANTCSNKVFLQFNSGTFNTIFYDASNCNSSQTVSRGFSSFTRNIIKFNSLNESGYLRITEIGSNSYTVCFSDNGSTDENISFTECYNVER